MPHDKIQVIKNIFPISKMVYNAPCIVFQLFLDHVLFNILIPPIHCSLELRINLRYGLKFKHIKRTVEPY